MQTESISTHLCPMCHKPNLCKMATNSLTQGWKDDTSTMHCWCFKMSKEINNEAIALNKKNASSKLRTSHEACYCQSCLEKIRQSGK